MADKEVLKARVEELADRDWDLAGIEARYRKLAAEGIPKKKLEPEKMVANKEEILDRVQRRAEEYTRLFHNCPQGTATALFEEFGLGSMEIIKAICPFPGYAGRGDICGSITGSVITLGLYFGSDDVLNGEATGATIATAKQFISSFKEELGYIHCADILENVVLGWRINPGDSEESMAAFAEAKGFEKCGLPPGISSRLAAGIMIDSMK